MNVLKLLRCVWRQPVYPHHRPEIRTVHYFVQYERVNHIMHPIKRLIAGLEIVTEHSDQIDEEIYMRLRESLGQIPGVQDLRIHIHESLLYDQEERDRALFSNIAHSFIRETELI